MTWYTNGFCILIASSVVALSYSLKCLTCFNALRPELCKSIGECPTSQNHCGKHRYFDIVGDLRYNVGCFSDITCRQVPHLIGRRKRAISSTDCCETDLCNAPHLQTTSVTATTTQTTTSLKCPENPDCPFLIRHHFDICNDRELSEMLCPASCGKCDVTHATAAYNGQT